MCGAFRARQGLGRFNTAAGRARKRQGLQRTGVLDRVTPSQGCLTCPLPVVRVRAVPSKPSIACVWNTSTSCENYAVCTVFPERQRGPESIRPTEIGEPAQTKRETLIVEAGTAEDVPIFQTTVLENLKQGSARFVRLVSA